ncbi:methyltransferase [Bradyrhizobium sp. LTSPM299]|uniref:TylF/MycF/NovP-related O-methyltransferase n=1 Tax=Bradyrhizobium sp. LTSPM299 TaxID=1619233 RepID=UPI0005CAC524|nr:TylF/MycF/NovP-related O-methyltransferase [Bradyrhizobium sp. LTSPM299]KJC53662.1 methyltransferase [Bradyrhizobium sp. LTSPM299]
MNNFYITQYFNWRVRPVSYLDHGVSMVLRAFGIEHSCRTADFVDQIITRLRGRRAAFTYSGGMTNVEQRMNLYHLVKQVLVYDVDGDLVELGCNDGQSSVLITKILVDHGTNKKLSVFDSFEGLPSIGESDGTSYEEGGLATSEDRVRLNFKRYNLTLPAIHKGWFNDTLPNGLPERICFAYLDGDLYESILISLEHVYPKMTKGAICLIDDYCDPEINPLGWNKLPGVKKACDEYFNDKPEKVEFIYSGYYSHAYFRKL